MSDDRSILNKDNKKFTANCAMTIEKTAIKKIITPKYTINAFDAICFKGSLPSFTVASRATNKTAVNAKDENKIIQMSFNMGL